MQDKLIDVARLQREHDGVLKTIVAFLDVIGKSKLATTDEVREIAVCLADLRRNVSEYVHFEEYEVLPGLADYTADILRSGLVLEYDNISNSISELMEQSRVLSSDPSDRLALRLFQARLTEKMQEIRWLVKDHAWKQEVLLGLAYSKLE